MIEAIKYLDPLEKLLSKLQICLREGGVSASVQRELNSRRSSKKGMLDAADLELFT